VGKNVVFVPECHSTNTLATQLSQNPSASEGTVVITHNQTAGRGQRGNVWFAEPGQNLTLSILLKPGFLLIKEQFFLNIITSLAVRDLLSDYIQSDIYIKWPNDILVHQKKICGILIENQLKGQVIETAVVGIGLNINQRDFEVPTATSLAREANRPFELQIIFENLLSCVEARYLQLKQKNYAALRNAYLQHVYQRGERHQYEAASQKFEGEIIGIGEDGKLAVNTDGQIKYFDIKEIRYL
jgi:BirA family biotin operon repressor/biotin-[acetyl-CoA-carboxylase] ligase